MNDSLSMRFMAGMCNFPAWPPGGSVVGGRGEKNDVVVMAKIGFFPRRCRDSALRPPPRLLVTAGTDRDQMVGMINGKKVNGVYINGAPLYTAATSDPDKLVKECGPDSPPHACLVGRFVDNRFVYRQTFIIRSYEIGPDKTATMETLMNLLQVSSSGGSPPQSELGWFLPAP